MRGTIAILVALSLALVGGCGSEDRGSDRDTEEDNAPTSQPAPSESAAGPKAAALGERVVFNGVSVTVIEYRASVPPQAAAPVGQRWDSLLVLMCNDTFADEETLQPAFTPNAWRLLDDSFGEYVPSASVYPDFPVPAFPQNFPARLGTCVQGWITFKVAAGAALTSAEWRVGQKLGSWALQS